MGKLIKGAPIAKKIRKKTITLVTKLKKQGIIPKLAVILVGRDRPSQIYVEKKGQAARESGLNFVLHNFKESITTEKLITKIKTIQLKNDVSGIIVQLPLPPQIDKNMVLNSLDPKKDVDCLTDKNLQKLKNNTSTIIPPTPGAILEIMKSLGIKIPNKKITILGAGRLVGKPLAFILKNMGAKINLCNSKTKNIKEICLTADIIISGIGKKNILRGDMVKPGAVVIDAGVCFKKGRVYGDINLEEVLKKASFVTPPIGAVGPITVELLLLNTVLVAKKNYV